MDKLSSGPFITFIFGNLLIIGRNVMVYVKPGE